MSEALTLANVDQDGAIEETLEAVATGSRADFLRKATVMGGGIVGGGAVLGALAQPAFAFTSRDTAILNFALTLEYLEASFYTQAVARRALSGPTLSFARVVAAHERTHVGYLKKLLGRKAIKSPRFNFHGTTSSAVKFRETAQQLEDLGVKAYKGQAPRIQEAAVLKGALSIHTVEARHAAWIRDINGALPAPDAFDSAYSMSQVLAAVKKTHFIVTPPPPSRRRPSPPRRRTMPRFTG